MEPCLIPAGFLDKIPWCLNVFSLSSSTLVFTIWQAKFCNYQLITIFFIKEESPFFKDYKRNRILPPNGPPFRKER